MLPLVLSALHEIAFAPKFLPSRIDKERKAVLSERQMMNTIEYRVDCQVGNGAGWTARWTSVWMPLPGERS